MYQNKYQYSGREEHFGKRFYKINEYTNKGMNWLYYPSVTTITSLLPSPKLDAWKKEVGETKAKEIAKNAADRGTCMHEFLEVFLGIYNKNHNKKIALQETQDIVPNSLKEKGFSPEAISKGRKLFYNFYESNDFLGDFKFIAGLEEEIFSVKHRYAGTCDCAYFTEESLVIRDYKSASKEKSRDDIEAYYLQIAAYMVAYEEMYEMDVDKAQIMISNDKTGLQIFEVSSQEKDIYFEKFTELLNNFHNSFNYERIYEQSNS